MSARGGNRPIKENNPTYLRLHQLISFSNNKAVKDIKYKLIKAYEAKVKIRRAELAQENIDVDDMLGEIEDLHMGLMEHAGEIVLNEDLNVDIEIYPEIIPAPCPNVTPTSISHVINCRGPIEVTTSYIVSDSGAQIFTLGAGWLITKRGSIPSINISGPSQEMGQIQMYRGSGITRVNSVNCGSFLLCVESNDFIYPE